MDISARLVERAGATVGAEIEISKEITTIGRDPSTDITLLDNEVSRDHARILLRANSFYIEDLHSSNGTFVNGKRVRKKIRLQNKDLITIGERNVFEFALDELLENQINDFEPAKDDEQTVEEVMTGDRESDDEGIKIEENRSRKGKAIRRMNFLSRFPTWAIVLFIAVGFLIIFCLVPLVVIEITDQWCNLFSGFFNTISPGICPQ